MGDFPDDGDVVAITAWLNKKGFADAFTGWKADAGLGQQAAHKQADLPKEKREMLWALLSVARGDAQRGPSDLLQLLLVRLTDLQTSPPVIELSSLGGMEDQADRLFGKKLYGIDKVAEKFASHANKIFTNFSTGVPPNKTTYPLASLLSDKGTGKSSFLDRHAEIIRKHCENQQLKELLDPKSHPLVLNITLSSGTDYSAEEGSSVSGEDSIARRLVCSYAQAPWEDVRALSVGSYDLLKVLELIVQHHKQVNKMEAAQKVVVVLNVDDLNQVRGSALDQKKADFRVMEIASALRSLSMSGVLGCAVICLMAGTSPVQVSAALACSSIERFSASLPLLNAAEVLEAMKDCRVDEQYLSNPAFLQLLEETGGVPRVLRKVVEGLTVQYNEGKIDNARRNALEYLQEGVGQDLNAEEIKALLPFVVLGRHAPAMNDCLIPGSQISFEILRCAGMIFTVEGRSGHERLAMPLLLLRSLSSTSAAFHHIQSLLEYHQQRMWEKFCALFHSLLMQHYATHVLSDVWLSEFYQVPMAPDLEALAIKVDKNAEYEPLGKDVGAYRFPGTSLATNKECMVYLQKGNILVNHKGAPGGDCVMANPYAHDSSVMVVRSLFLVQATDDDLELQQNKIDLDRKKAVRAFKKFAPLSGAKVVTVHVTNCALHRSVVPTAQKDSIVISRNELWKFFGPTFQRGFLSAAAPRSAIKRTFSTLRGMDFAGKGHPSASGSVQVITAGRRMMRCIGKGLL